MKKGVDNLKAGSIILSMLGYNKKQDACPVTADLSGYNPTNRKAPNYIPNAENSGADPFKFSDYMGEPTQGRALFATPGSVPMTVLCA